MVREGIQKYIDEYNATLNEDDVRDFIDAYLLEIKHHKHEKNTLFTGKLSLFCKSVSLFNTNGYFNWRRQ